MKQVIAPENKACQEQVLSNCSKSAQRLLEKGYELVSSGTKNHLVLVSLRNKGIDCSGVEKVLESVHIIAIPGDVSAMVPGGIRIGTPALTSEDFCQGRFLKREVISLIQLPNWPWKSRLRSQGAIFGD